ncbi:alpha/beta hydrolase [Sphingomonas bacterium]|uniref:alpha/beta hydrolase n=1 Tax=Sphingomonas bacterium TaxID=1895847 RepID=UPI001575454B|nr:alpha/beta hydrolase [Sphingomonas bacterium]
MTFDNYVNATGLDRPAFGEAFLLGEGCSAIHLLGRGNDWYQYDDLPLALAAVREHLRSATRIITYGSSMGGYAALRCGAAVGAHVALALSPQYSNDPEVVPWERRWFDDGHRIRWLPALEDVLRFGTPGILLFDPLGQDRRHAALIASQTACTLVPLRHAGHPVATFLNEINLLRPLVAALREDHFDAAGFLGLARSRRRESSVYLSHLALAQHPRRIALAIDLAERARAKAPGSAIALQALGTILSRADRHDEAIAVLNEAVQLTRRTDPHYLYFLAEAFVAAGRNEDAIGQMADAIALAPELAHLRVWQAKALARIGDLRGAVRMQASAIRLAPQRRAYRTRLWKYWGQLIVSAIRRVLGVSNRSPRPAMPR